MTGRPFLPPPLTSVSISHVLFSSLLNILYKFYTFTYLLTAYSYKAYRSTQIILLLYFLRIPFLIINPRFPPSCYNLLLVTITRFSLSSILWPFISALFVNVFCFTRSWSLSLSSGTPSRPCICSSTLF